MQKERVWLIYFNPCGSAIVGDYGNRTCAHPQCGEIPCLKKASYQAADEIIKGSDSHSEKAELVEYISSLSGTNVIGVDNQVILVRPQNASHLADNVIARGQQIIDGIESCIRNTTPIGPGTISRLPMEERVIANRLRELNQAARTFHGNENGARQLAVEIEGELRKALRFGLTSIDLIARQALAYGLADQIPFIDSSGLIFIGDPSKITKLPGRFSR